MPCGCLANSIISLDKAGQDNFFILLMSSPWQAPQAPTRRCKACCKPQSKYTPWTVSCFGRCIMSQLLHHILATALHLASHIVHRASHRASCVAPHFPHCMLHIARRASLPTSRLTSLCHTVKSTTVLTQHSGPKTTVKCNLRIHRTCTRCSKT